MNIISCNDTCRDKPKFGGPGVQKQKCQEKKCTNPVVSFKMIRSPLSF